jgi:hypothetical protein
MDWTEFEVSKTVEICEGWASCSNAGKKLMLVSKLAKAGIHREAASQILRAILNKSAMVTLKIKLVSLLSLLDSRIAPAAELVMLADDVEFIGDKCSASVSKSDCTLLITGPVDVVYRAVKAVLADK